jgi:hypothetical protein
MNKSTLSILFIINEFKYQLFKNSIVWINNKI